MEGQSPSESDGKAQLRAWGALWCNALITVRVVWDVKEVCLVVGHLIIQVRTVSLWLQVLVTSIIYFIKFVLRAVFCKNLAGWWSDHLKISELLHILLVLMS